jgi:hypothetical protein
MFEEMSGVDKKQLIDDREAVVAYLWDRKNLFFIGAVLVDPDPLDLERWVKPICSTFEEPPQIEKNQVAVRDVKNSLWLVKSDFRGVEYWDENGRKHTITELGEEVPEDALLEAPVIPPTVEEQTALANAECSKRINAHWNQIGQINASLGVYGEEDAANCAAWISSNRAALVELLARDDLLEIDVTSDEHWPIFEDESE